MGWICLRLFLPKVFRPGGALQQERCYASVPNSGIGTVKSGLRFNILHAYVFPQIVGFIHHNMFALYAGQNLHLLEIAPHEDSRPPHAIHLLHTLPSVEFDLLSGIRWTPGASHLVLLNKGLLRGVHIPHDQTLPPIFVEFGRYQPDYSRRSWLTLQFGALGISTSILPTGSGSPLEVVTHCWNDSGRQGGLIRKPALVDIRPEWAENSDLIPIMWSDDLSRTLLLVNDHSSQSRGVLLILDLM